MQYFFVTKNLFVAGGYYHCLWFNKSQIPFTTWRNDHYMYKIYVTCQNPSFKTHTANVITTVFKIAMRSWCYIAWDCSWQFIFVKKEIIIRLMLTAFSDSITRQVSGAGSDRPHAVSSHKLSYVVRHILSIQHLLIILWENSKI